MEKYIKENGITYELRGEQYYPLLELPEQKEVGKYGRLHLEYLKEHRKGHYTNLLSEGVLNQRLYEIDVEAKTMVESIISRLAIERGIDENLKSHDNVLGKIPDDRFSKMMGKYEAEQKALIEAVAKAEHSLKVFEQDKVDFYFTAAGLIDIPDENELREMMEKIRKSA